MKRIFCLFGNGITIDFIKHINSDDIDVVNLFRLGNQVSFPKDGRKGFLSYAHCPNLWTLGGMPSISKERGAQLIEEIITCMNVQSIRDARSSFNSVYHRAYAELTWYIRFLFIHYNKLIEDTRLEKRLDEWAWAKWLNTIYRRSDIEEVHIVTYNYDLWLERVLKLQNIDYNVIGTNDNKSSAKFSIYKPHGSINFKHIDDPGNEATSFEMRQTSPFDTQPSELMVAEGVLENYFLQNLIIPPSGEATRSQKSSWAAHIREAIDKTATSLTSSDEVIIGGLSYGSVDRREIDSILINLPDSARISVVNPGLSLIFNSVLSSLFQNMILFNSAEGLL